MKTTSFCQLTGVSLIFFSSATFACLPPNADAYKEAKCYEGGYARVTNTPTRMGNDNFGLLDPQGKLILPLNYRYIGEFHSDRAIIKLIDYKYNYIDKNANKISNINFRGAEDFVNGFGRVETSKKKYNYVDKNGNLLSKIEFDDVEDFKNGIAKVKIGQKFNFIDTSGHLLSSTHFDEVKEVSEGFIAVKLNDKWGYIDTKGNMVITPKYFKANSFRKFGGQLRAVVSVLKYNKKYQKNRKYAGIIDATGNYIITPSKYTGMYFLQNDSGVAVTYNYSNDAGLADGITGKELLPNKYGNGGFQNIKFVKNSDDLIFINVPFDTRYIYNTRTHQLTEGVYISKHSELVDGMIQVFTRRNRGYIDATGKLVIPPQFPDDTDVFERSKFDFYNGFAFANVKDGWNFIDKKGNFLLQEPAYSLKGFNEGLAAVKTAKGWGFINKSGKVVIPYKYKEVSSFKDAKASVSVKYDGYYPRDFEIDKSGKALTKLKSLASFRKGLEVGDDTKQGMVVEIKGNLVLIQAEGEQCSQRDYNGNCKNWISKSDQEWIKKDKLVPVDY